MFLKGCTLLLQEKTGTEHHREANTNKHSHEKQDLLRKEKTLRGSSALHAGMFGWQFHEGFISLF